MFLIVHILIFIALVLGGQACDLKGIACLNSTTYQICRKYGDEVVYLGSPKTCSKGLGCHETIGFFPCIDESYIPATTTARPVANCDSGQSVKFVYYDGNVLNCDKYYECVKVFWWWELQTKTCASGTRFSALSLDCQTNISPDTCTPDQATTVAPGSTTPPPQANCNDNVSKKIPYYNGNVQDCTKYYQCEKDWIFWWYNLREESCPSGTAFSSDTLQCDEGISLDTCKPYVTTTLPTTTVITTPRATPNCDENKSVRFPYYDGNVQNCAKYYQCEKDWLFPWYNLKEKSCSSGTAFYSVTLECEENISLETCKPPETTTVTTTTTTTLPTTTTKRPTPNCNDNKSIRFPFYDGNTLNCGKYYQCEKDWIFPWYNLKEKTCATGTAFSTVTLQCESTISPDTCKPYETTTLPTTTTTTTPSTTTPSTTTLSTTTTLRPKPNCDENKSIRFAFYNGNVQDCTKYYQCEKDWIFPYYDLKEKTCPSGTGFSSVTLECDATISLDTCKPYETTTLPTTTTTAPTTTTPSTTTQPTTTTIPPKPNCDDNKSVRYPFYEGSVLNCAKYYECEKDWIFPYYDLKEKACPSGTGFSSVTLECEATISLDTCKPYETTTLPTTTTTPPTTTTPSTTTQPTTTTIPSKPNCDDNKSVRYPFYEGNVLNCAKYYECEKDWIFPYYDLKEKSCPSGTGFSSVTLECESTISIDTCESIETTSSVTTLTSTTTSSTTTPPTTALPTTTTPRPTPNCNENKSVTFPFYNGNILNCAKYYACEKDWIFPWYNLKEKTCPSGTGFSIITLECLSTISPQTCA